MKQSLPRMLVVVALVSAMGAMELIERTSSTARISNLSSASVPDMEPLSKSRAHGRVNGPQPNIIFILADDLGWGDPACFGNREILTPNIDAMASEGTLFTRYYSCAPICSPARAAILSGQHPAEIGVHTVFRGPDRNEDVGMENYLAPSLAVLPRMLEASGYATGHYGKWHLGHIRAPGLEAYGFQEHRTILSDPSNPQYNRANHVWRSHSSDLIVGDAIDFIDRHSEEPFYLNVWLHDPHAIVDPSDAQRSMYPDMVPDTYGEFTSARQAYYAVVTAMDNAIGRLIDAVDQRGLAHNTIIIFTSDNGPKTIYSNNGDHSGVGSSGPFRGRKLSLYEGGVRMPLIVRWSGVTPAGAVDNETAVAATDWVPTLVTLTGTDCSILEPEVDCSELDGEDMSAALLGAPLQRSGDILMQWRFGHGSVQAPRINVSPDLAIIRGPWKLMMNRDETREELYNVVSDPMEVDNLSGEVPFTLLTELRLRLRDWESELPPCLGCEDGGDNSYPWPD